MAEVAYPVGVHGLAASPAYDVQGIALFVCNLDDDQDVLLREAKQLLSPTEQTRAERFIHSRDQARYTRCRGFLRRTLGKAMRCDPKSLAIVEGAHGKPQLAQVAGPKPDFNVSHSKGTAVIALSWSGPVGVDIELRDRQLKPLLLADTVLVPAETEALSDLPPDQAADLFLRFWTAKEARMKLTGDGMSLDPRRIELKLDNGRAVGFQTPNFPQAELRYPDLERPGMICALVTLEKPDTGKMKC